MSQQAKVGIGVGLLAQIKLQDPSDTSELSVSDSALTSYCERLGLEAPAEVEETSVEQPLEDAAPADDNLDQLIEESRADTSAQQSPPMDMTEEIQEQNEEIPADTSGNQPPPAIPDSSGTY